MHCACCVCFVSIQYDSELLVFAVAEYAVVGLYVVVVVVYLYAVYVVVVYVVVWWRGLQQWEEG